MIGAGEKTNGSVWHYALLLGGLAILGRILLLPILPHPIPSIHDEFSYLLAAETFAAGKLSVAPHPHAQFFETFHVLSSPRYMSKYPPGQAVVLAMGILLSHAHTGVIVSFGLFVVTAVWILRSVVPVKWAIFGGLWTLLTFNVRLYWLESYWGGFVAAIGGNLVLGSLLYSLCQKRPAARWWFVPGALVLAVTRPYEGLAFVISVFVAFFAWQRLADRQQFVKSARLFVAPVLLTAAVVALVVGGYHWQTLGSPLQFPHLEYQKQYGFAEFWPLPLPDKTRMNHPAIERLYTEWSVNEYEQLRANSPLVLIPMQIYKIVVVALLTFGLSAAAIAVMPLLCWRHPTIRILATVLLATALFVSFEVWTFPHYLAPLTGAVICLGVGSLREAHDRVVSLSWPIRLIALLALVGPLVQSVRYVNEAKRQGTAHSILPLPIRYRETARNAIETKLEAMGGSHVVFVRYSPSHYLHEEWVYNSPDIDSQRVIWARDRGQENRALQEYYPDRTFWLVEPDVSPPQPVRLALR